MTEVSRVCRAQVPAELLNGESRLQSRHVNPNAPWTAQSAPQRSGGGSEGGSGEDDEAGRSEGDQQSDENEGGYDREGGDGGVVRGGGVEEVKEPAPARMMGQKSRREQRCLVTRVVRVFMRVASS